jgi:hypothetical protein
MPRLGDRVKDTSTTAGAGDFTLSGVPPTGFTSFNAKFGLNDDFCYVIDDGAGNWESGVGYLSAATTLVRSIIRNSSTGSIITFGVGSKTVFVDALESYLERTQRGRTMMMTTGRFLS